MAERDYYVTSAGLAERALTGERLYTLEDAFVRYLSAGDYYGAFSAYIRQCDYQLLHKDDPLPGEEPDPVRTAGGVLASLGLGFLGSLLPVGAMKSKNTNVAKKQTATNYARPGSLQMYVQNDNYLRTETSRVLIQTNAGRTGGGGGTSHMSSGGVSHTGGGGKF